MLRSAGSLRRSGTGRPTSLSLPVVGICCDEPKNELAALLAAFGQGFCVSTFRDVELARVDLPEAGVPPGQADWVTHPGIDLLLVAGSHKAAAIGGAIMPPIPIVFIASHVDRLGLVESAGRPGRNATGVDLLGKQVMSRRLEYLTMLVPDSATIHFLYDPRLDDPARLVAEARAVGRQGIAHSVAGPADARAVLSAFKSNGTAALDIPGSVMQCIDEVLVEKSSERYRIPTSFERADCARAGGILSYGPVLASAYRQAGVLAARVLAGESPGAIPVQQAHDFALSLNETVAKRFGLQVPPSLRKQANEIIG